MPWPKGVHRPAPTKAKLTPAQVIEIRLRYATGNESYRKIAEAYGLRHDTVYKIVNGYTWQHLPEASAIYSLPREAAYRQRSMMNAMLCCLI